MPAPVAAKPPDGSTRIERHRTALSRTDFSRPIARALFDGLITEETTVLDYGCGRGGDVKRLSEMGVDVAGFDPRFAPDTELRSSRIVNLGFVVNVIEDPQERADVLLKAWDLTEGVLIVSARLMDEARRLEAKNFGDGVLTDLGTFQKFYEQGELKEWIEEVLSAQPIAAEPGVFYVFRHTAEAQLFVLTKVRRNPPAPKRSEAVFEEHQELLNQLTAFFERAGRLPRTGELSCEADLRAAVGTPREAWRIILNVTGEEKWDRIRSARYDDLLVYLALLRFQGSPKFSEFPQTLRHDIRDFFRTYKSAQEQATKALFAISDLNRTSEAIRSSSVGKKLPHALFVHAGALFRLPTGLRILEGCARAIVGQVADEPIVRFEDKYPRVVYLDYPRFREDAFPALNAAYRVDLRTMKVDHAKYSNTENSPILHRKELFVDESFPGREVFLELTKQVREAGLGNTMRHVRRRREWDDLLERNGLEIVNHELRWS